MGAGKTRVKKALDKQKKKTRAPPDSLSIPKEVRRRFLRKSGNVRIHRDVLHPLDKACTDTINQLVLLSVRLAVLDGRSTLKARDLEQALEISDIHVY